MTDPDDGETTYTYNVGNRLTSLTNPLDETTDFTYDTLGRLTRQDNENGTYGTWTFDDAGRASAVATKKSDDTTILSLSYTRDNVGNPTSVSEALLDTDDQTTHNATLTYTYDDLHRLTSEKRTTSQPIWYEYTMDAAGNRTQFVEKDQQGQVVGTTNATYSDDNRLLTYGNLAYDWDDNGNLTSKTVNQVETTYGWDYENKLTSLTDGHTLTFSYNGDGLRQSRTVDGTTTRYVYSGMRLLQETNSGGTTQAAYTLAPMGGQWEPMVSHRKSGASRFYAFDALGTTRVLTDGSEGVAAVFTDDAWGNVLNASDSAATAHQYVGRYGYYLDGATGLQLLTLRYLDPTMGRWVSEDPAKDNENWFTYGEGNPVVTLDPSGLGVDLLCRDRCDTPIQWWKPRQPGGPCHGDYSPIPTFNCEYEGYKLRRERWEKQWCTRRELTLDWRPGPCGSRWPWPHCADAGRYLKYEKMIECREQCFAVVPTSSCFGKCAGVLGVVVGAPSFTACVTLCVQAFPEAAHVCAHLCGHVGHHLTKEASCGLCNRVCRWTGSVEPVQIWERSCQ